MPIYEYRCQDCGKKSTFIMLSVKAALEPKGKRCGGSERTTPDEADDYYCGYGKIFLGETCVEEEP